MTPYLPLPTNKVKGGPFSHTDANLYAAAINRANEKKDQGEWRDTSLVDARDFNWVNNPNVDQTSVLQSAINETFAANGRLIVPFGVTSFTNLILPYTDISNGATMRVLEIFGQGAPAQMFGTANNYPMPTSGTVFNCIATEGSAFIVPEVPGAQFGGISLLHLVAENFTLRLVNPGIHGLRAGRVSQLRVRNLQVDTGIFSAACPLPINNATGLETPILYNGAITRVENYSASGMCYGLVGNEHIDADCINLTSNLNGLLINGSDHAQLYKRVTIQRCQKGVAIQQDLPAIITPRFEILQLNIEHASPGQVQVGITDWQLPVADLYDPGSCGHGKITWHTVKGDFGQKDEFFKIGGAGVHVEKLGSKQMAIPLLRDHVWATVTSPGYTQYGGIWTNPANALSAEISGNLPENTNGAFALRYESNCAGTQAVAVDSLTGTNVLAGFRFGEGNALEYRNGNAWTPTGYNNLSAGSYVRMVREAGVWQIQYTDEGEYWTTVHTYYVTVSNVQSKVVCEQGYNAAGKPSRIVYPQFVGFVI